MPSPHPTRAALERALAPLAPLAGRLVAFVQDGSNEAALAELTAVEDAATKLSLLQQAGSGPLVEAVADAARDPAVLLRLARVLAAAAGESFVEDLGADARWVESLVWATSNLGPNSEVETVFTAIEAAAVEGALRAAGLDPALLVRVICGRNAGARDPHARRHFVMALLAMPGTGAMLARHADVVRDTLRGESAEMRVVTLKKLTRGNAEMRPFVDDVVAVALESKEGLEAAKPLLAREPDAARARLQALLHGKLPKKVRVLAERALEALGPETEALAPPTRPHVRPVPPVSDEMRRVLAETVDTWMLDFSAQNAARQRLNLVDKSELRVVTKHEVAEMIDCISSARPWESAPIPTLARFLRYPGGLEELMSRLASAPLHPAHIVRLLRFFVAGDAVLFEANRVFERRRANGGRECDLRAFSEACDAAALDGRNALLWALHWSSPWDVEEALSLLAERPEALEAALGVRTLAGFALPPNSGESALEALARITPFPPTLAPAVLRIALEGDAATRPLAQRAAQRIDGWENHAIAALGAGLVDTRVIAARWLGRGRAASAREALLAASRKEKRETARAAMMEALELLGEPLDTFLDRAGLLADAGARAATATLPAWLDVSRLPALVWGDTGARVEAAIVRAWLASAHKVKSPSPTPLLRMYARGLRADTARGFAAALLDRWIERDATGSAVADKGLLAVVAALGGRGIAAPVAAYLRTWYGWRPAQCKALLEMVSWIDDREATLLLLVTASRFRTPGIREHAEELVTALAARRGWSIDELADRTTPSAGLDDAGALALTYGRRGDPPGGEGDDTLIVTRTFTARLSPNAALELRDAAGTVVKALPDARNDEDDEIIKRAKRDFARAKKELAGLIRATRERLYAAMCTQRAWRFDDWDVFLHRHPVVGHLCVGLVWTAAADATIRTFRPLGDGSLTSAGHDAVALPPDAIVRVAHASQLARDEIAAWAEHLADFEVISPFTQLGRRLYDVGAEAARATELTTFRGHLIESFTLRGRATALGYARGPTEDGGRYFTYEKPFHSLGIDAVIEFSGSRLPEEKRTVALVSLAFRMRRGGRGSTRAALGNLPAVLVSETHADMAEIAAAGTGFDAGWEAKVEL